MKRISVPVDDNLAEALTSLSRENFRSTGAEAAVILRDYFMSRAAHKAAPRASKRRRVPA